uniref:Homeobox domain-containing protein n=1 Tax=Kalanchoe fedtschenkoi TaxID=63787 RepID=A0A7N0UAH4_KALFE
MESSTSSVPPPPKRHKLPLHPPPAAITISPPPHDRHPTDSLRNLSSTRQPTPLGSTPFSTSSLCSGPARPRDLARGGLSLSLSSDRPRCIGRDSPVRAREAWRGSAVPLGPFTGYASILSRSRFLKPAQDLLDELCGVDSRPVNRSSFHGFCDSAGIVSMDLDDVAGNKDSGLILLLDEVFKRCKQYCQHLQSVVASFETVPGLGNAAPYTSFALGTMAQQFRCLKKTIFERARVVGEAIGYEGVNSLTLGCREPHQSSENWKPVQTSPSLQHPVWRSQRGLPAHAVTVFKNWLFEHFLHPYPSDTDKNLLAQRTGLSRNQVSNWFINARVRLWKPLVEEIHTLDEQRGQPADPKSSKRRTPTLSFDHPPRDFDLPMLPGQQRQERRNPSCSESYLDNLSTSASKHSRTEENIGISLALGLQQESGLGNPASHGAFNL